MPKRSMTWLDARNHKARLGETNGRCVLRNPAVVLIRDLYKGETPIKDLAERFKISERHVKRIVQGDMRREAGGEIVDTVGDYIRSFFAQVAIEGNDYMPIPVDDERMPAVSPFDLSAEPIRCKCGARCYPSTSDPTLCMSCANKARKR